jgi:hypothetical protein
MALPPRGAVPHAAARPRLSAALTETLRRCQTSESAGLEVLAPAMPGMAAAILEEAANSGGGMVWRPRQGGLWLLGSTQGATGRALAVFEGMGWPARLLAFPASVRELELALETEAEFTPAATPPPPEIAGIEEVATRLGTEAGQSLETIWRLAAGKPGVIAQRWTIDPAALPCPPGRDWLGHAANLLATRLWRRAQAGDWPAGRKRNLALLLDMPWMPLPETLPPPPEGEGHTLLLPLAAAPEAAEWAVLAARDGWRLGWCGLDATLAHLASPARLPGHIYIAGCDAAARAATWPAPELLALTGCEDKAALGFAVAHGIAICSRMGG